MLNKRADEITDARQMNTCRLAELIVQLAGVCGLANNHYFECQRRFFCWGPTNGSVLIKIQYNTNLTQQVTRAKQRTVQSIVSSSHPNTSVAKF